ncbi:MAG: cellulase family glycosylhydrolase [Actinomycetales bacterium]|nr:cellulase family glycosylhydrolase [Actinomycetales bacterium]
MILTGPHSAGGGGGATSTTPHRRRLGTTLRTGLALLGVTAAMLTVNTGPAEAASPSFVERCGIHFCVDGKTYYFAGTNTYDFFTYGGSWGETETQYMDKARIDKHMAQLAADRVSVVRLWMFSHESWHGFEPSEGVYNDQQFALFDYVIESAKAHGIRLIPVFENYWEAYGGIDTRLSWEGLTGGHPGRATFFNKAKCPGCFTQYKNYVNYALNRVNHYSGVAYKDDPTIFAWELMNEPRYQDVSAEENVSGATLRAWVDEMGAYVKSIDSNHLLGAGLEAHESRFGFGGDEGNPFIHIQQSPYIDFTSAHPYPDAGWAALDIAETRALIRTWVTESHEVIGKPFFMGEWNVTSNHAQWWPEIYAELEASGADGSAFWWYKDGSGGGGHDMVAGMSVLSVFRDHSARMAAKSGSTQTTTTRPTTTTTTRPTTTTTTTTRPTTTTTTTTRPTTTTTTTRPTTTTTTTRPTTTTTTSTTRPTTTTTTGSGDRTCSVAYAVQSQWPGGFVASVTVTAGGSPISGWRVTLTLPGGATLTNAWNGVNTGTTGTVTVTNQNYNGALGAGATTNFGFQGTGTGAGATVTCTAS